MIREAIARLVDGQSLTREEARQTMSAIMGGEATPAQIGAFITALRIRGETPEVIAGCAEAMREKATPIDAGQEVVVDTCGTGGDRSGTFNISTAAAFVAAGAGLAVAKHGNRSVSSRSGSADVLEALGVDLSATPDVMAACLREVGIAFLFAPALHPAMRHAIGPRREIGIRSVFNILGPLCNPAGARHGVLGVYDRNLVDVLAHALAELGARHVFVVHGSDGLDELTTTGPSTVAEVRGGAVSVGVLDPATLGLPRSRPDDLRGGTPEENAGMVRAVLAGEKGPRRDIVLLNAAACIVAGGKAPDLKEGLAVAARAVDSGEASRKLQALVDRSRSH